MTGYEQQTSGIENGRIANCATTTDLIQRCLLNRIEHSECQNIMVQLQ